jgi:hypothetical protein
MYLISALITALLMLLGPALAFAQTEDPPLEIGSVAVQGSVRTRVEGWDWFTDPSYENTYAYPGTRIRLSFSQQRQDFDWNFEVGVIYPHDPNGLLGFLEINYRF